MLKISKDIEYALFAIKFIDENDENRPVSVKEISETLDIPFELLAKIMQRLVKKNMITSHQGIKGGYSLNIDPGKVNLFTLIDALGQQTQLTNCMVDNPTIGDCKRVNDCCLRDPMQKIQHKINQVFLNTTINEVIN